LATKQPQVMATSLWGHNNCIPKFFRHFTYIIIHTYICPVSQAHAASSYTLLPAHARQLTHFTYSEKFNNYVNFIMQHSVHATYKLCYMHHEL